MKTLWMIGALCLVASLSAMAQRDYKHPYGLQREKTVEARTKKTVVTTDQNVLVQRNYKNPQRDRSDQEVVVIPGNPVQNVTNPLVADRNYKLQNRRKAKQADVRKQDDVFAEDK